MKVTNGEIWVMAEALTRIGKMDLPVKTSFAVLKNIKAVRETIQLIESTRQNLIKKHGEDGKVTPASKGYPAFREAWSELMAIETDVDLTMFDLPEDARIDAETLMTIEKIIKENNQ